LEYEIIRPKISIVQIMSNDFLENSDDTIRIGKYNSKNLFRILFKISMDKLPQNAKIVDATLIINIKHVGTGYPNIITPYALMENWDLENVTWDNQPYFNNKICVGSINVTKRCKCKLKITSIVEKWYKNEISNFGLVLKNNEKESKTISKIVADMDSNCKPTIKIFYIKRNSDEIDFRTQCPIEFTDKVEEFNTDDKFSFSALRNTSLKNTVVFLVKNIGNNTLTAHLQVSPDGINFIDEPFTALIGMNEIKYLIPCMFSKFTRVAVKDINSIETSCVRIWYQAQSLN